MQEIVFSCWEGMPLEEVLNCIESEYYEVKDSSLFSFISLILCFHNGNVIEVNFIFLWVWSKGMNQSKSIYTFVLECIVVLIFVQALSPKELKDALLLNLSTAFNM